MTGERTRPNHTRLAASIMAAAARPILADRGAEIRSRLLEIKPAPTVMALRATKAQKITQERVSAGQRTPIVRRVFTTRATSTATPKQRNAAIAIEATATLSHALICPPNDLAFSGDRPPERSEEGRSSAATPC